MKYEREYEEEIRGRRGREVGAHIRVSVGYLSNIQKSKIGYSEAVFKVIKSPPRGYRVRGLLQYIARLHHDADKEIKETGGLELIDSDGFSRRGQKEIEAIYKEWKVDFERKKRGSKKQPAHVRHMVFSVDKSVKSDGDLEGFKRAAYETALKEFGDRGFKFVVGVHLDKEHPHMHLVVKCRNEYNGRKLKVTKADILRIRMEFAKKLEANNLKYTATLAKDVGRESESVSRIKRGAEVKNVNDVKKFISRQERLQKIMLERVKEFQNLGGVNGNGQTGSVKIVKIEPLEKIKGQFTKQKLQAAYPYRNMKVEAHKKLLLKQQRMAKNKKEVIKSKVARGYDVVGGIVKANKAIDEAKEKALLIQNEKKRESVVNELEKYRNLVNSRVDFNVAQEMSRSYFATQLVKRDYYVNSAIESPNVEKAEGIKSVHDYAEREKKFYEKTLAQMALVEKGYELFGVAENERLAAVKNNMPLFDSIEKRKTEIPQYAVRMQVAHNMEFFKEQVENPEYNILIMANEMAKDLKKGLENIPQDRSLEKREFEQGLEQLHEFIKTDEVSVASKRYFDSRINRIEKLTKTEPHVGDLEKRRKLRQDIKNAREGVGQEIKDTRRIVQASNILPLQTRQTVRQAAERFEALTRSQGRTL